MRNGQAYQRKTEKFSISKEKKFGKIDSSIWFSNLKKQMLKLHIWGNFD